MKQNVVKKFQKRFKWFPKGNPLYRLSDNVPMWIDCDEGWFKLLWKLCEDIDVIILREKFEDFNILQIKEKFGGLRFYTGSTMNEIEDLVDKAEEESYRTCELCGKPGSMHVKFGWYKTLCGACAEKNGFEEVEKVENL